MGALVGGSRDPARGADHSSSTSAAADPGRRQRHGRRALAVALADQAGALRSITPPYANRANFLQLDRRARSRVPLSDPSQWVGLSRLVAGRTPPRGGTQGRQLDACRQCSTLQTGALRRLTNERGQTWVRSWSPDGKKIAAAVFRDGRWDLRWIDASSGATGSYRRAFRRRTSTCRYPEWSPRGDAVVYERGELRGNVWMLRLNAPRPVQTITTETLRRPTVIRVGVRAVDRHLLPLGNFGTHTLPGVYSQSVEI